jgi:IS30 family transposase
MLFYRYQKTERHQTMEHLNNTTNLSKMQEINSKKSRLKYNHLNLTKRQNIEVLYNTQVWALFNKEISKINYSSIAKKVGCNRSTIIREIKKGLFEYRTYKTSGTAIFLYASETADNKSKLNREKSHSKTKLDNNSNELKSLRNLVNTFNISPEQAILLYNSESTSKFPVCLKTIYKYIRTGLVKFSKGYINLRVKYKKQPKEAKTSQKGDNIANRPESCNNRTEFGHFEGDLIVGVRGGSKECILTLVERKTRFVLALKIKDKSQSSVVDAFNRIERITGYNNFIKLFKSVTFDNGKEFCDIEGIENSIFTKEKRLKTFFANPYCSWERGSNENVNKQLRKIFPKKTDFGYVKDKDIEYAVNKLNHLKRKAMNSNSSIDCISKEDIDLLLIINSLGSVNPFKKLSKLIIG